MSALDGSIVIIALPAIFRGIHLDPLAPGNISYLLWMIMGYRLIQAVLVVTLGRLGDMYGRVRIYNAGFVVFTAASILLSFDPFSGTGGAQWLIGWRALQAVGGSMLTANSAAILTDAFPADQRGFALGTNQIAAIGGQFIGLVAGGVLAAVDWRAVFWVNVPVGIFGTVWAYRKLRETSDRHGGRIDWWGNVTFAVGLSAILIAVTYGIQPYGGHAMGWTNPMIWAAMLAGVGAARGLRRDRAAGRRADVPARPVPDPGVRGRQRRRLHRVGRPRRPAVHADHLAAGHLAAAARLRLQLDTPLWAGIFLLPLTAAFLVSGPLFGTLSDRFGARGVRNRRHAAVRRQLRRPAVPAGELLLLGVRGADHASTAWASACSARPTRRRS